jgi:hypothetical protein
LFLIGRFLKNILLGNRFPKMNQHLVGSTLRMSSIKLLISFRFAKTHGRRKRFPRRIFFRNRPIRNKNCLWRTCLLTDRDEISNRYRGPSIDASYQVSVHWTKRFQRRTFF